MREVFRCSGESQQEDPRAVTTFIERAVNDRNKPN
jgi:hypothetical protein